MQIRSKLHITQTDKKNIPLAQQLNTQHRQVRHKLSIEVKYGDQKAHAVTGAFSLFKHYHARTIYVWVDGVVLAPEAILARKMGLRGCRDTFAYTNI